MSPKAARASLTVVVPVYNAASTLGSCLEALARSQPAPDEVIVFDDGSTDSTPEIATRAGVRMIGGRDTNRGPAHARNEGVKASRGELIAFVDADVVVHPDAFALLEAPIASGEALATFGSYDDRPSSQRFTALYGNLRHHWVHQRGSNRAATFWSGLSMIDRALFLGHGGFDERIRCCEDVELGTRLTEAGALIRLVKEAQGKHLKDWTLLQLWRSDICCRAIPWARMIREGRGRVLDLNLSLRERASAVAAHMVCLALFLALAWPAAWPVVIASAAIYVGCSFPFLRFLFGSVGLLAGTAGTLLHWCYHIYSSTAFLLVRLKLI